MGARADGRRMVHGSGGTGQGLCDGAPDRPHMNGLFWRPLLAFGTEEQKKKYLPKLATEIWAANSLTEPRGRDGERHQFQGNPEETSI